MPTIGLTGNFGMGKTTVLRLFRSMGAHVFSSDKYVHQILQKPEIIQSMSGLLGPRVTSGSGKKRVLNKKAIASIVFNDHALRKAVEEIIHPEVLKAVQSDMKAVLAHDSSAVIVVEVPLLFESGFDKYFDKTAVVFCRLEEAMKRASEKGFAPEDVKKRLRAQMPITVKKRLADYRIENNGDITSLENRIKRIFSAIQKSI